MKRLVLGVIGHVDHGKTALVQALTGQDTDRLREEKERGISIALGFAHFAVASDAEVDLIDMPGHERFVRTMVSGATGIDAVLLVVAANEGVQPQTVEHVDIASLLGLRRAVVAISKTDLVAQEDARRVSDKVISLLAERGIDSPPPVLTSALQARGIDPLREAIAALAGEHKPRSAEGLLFLPIDRAFTMLGHGAVVTGTLRGAAVTAGDVLELLPHARPVRVRSVQVHGARVATALPGQRVALNLRDVEIASLKRGMTLSLPEALELSSWLTISIGAVAGAPPLKNGMRLRALFGTGEIEVRLRLLDRDVVQPGQPAFAQLNCVEPVAIPAGEHVVLRLASPPQTVAGGKILESVTRRRRRNDPSVLDRLDQLRSLPPAKVIAAEVERAGTAGTTLRHLSRLSALVPSQVVALLRDVPILVARSGLVVQKADLDRLAARIMSLLALHQAGLSQSRLQAALPGAGGAVIGEAIGQLLARGAINKRGSQFVLPRPDLDRARAEDESELAARIAEMLRSAHLAPPKPDEIMVDPPSKRAVERLLRAGVIIRAVDRAKGKEILFHRDAIEDARRRLAPLLADEPGLLVTEIGAALGISRKYSMPLVDHLDSIRFTRRIGDRRMLHSASAPTNV